MYGSGEALDAHARETRGDESNDANALLQEAEEVCLFLVTM